MKIPANFGELPVKQNTIARKLRAIDLEARAKVIEKAKSPELVFKCSAKSKTFDWRRLGKVTAIQDQAPCGTCWDFGAIAAYESSYAIRNGDTIDASEQQILACAKGDDGKDAGVCPFPPGGWHGPVFQYLVSTGTAREVDYPYTGADSPCNVVDLPYRAVAWGFVPTEVPPGFVWDIPTRGEVKQALCDYGPLAVTIYATPLLQMYTGLDSGGDVFEEAIPEATLHPVDASGKT